jgi:hypothetical protein
MNKGTCINFNGIQFPCCKAGVNYHDAFNGKTPGLFMRMPCIEFRERPIHGNGTYIKAGEKTMRVDVCRKGESAIPCSLRQEPTDEQIQADRKETDEHFEKVQVALKVASEWRIKPRPDHDRVETIECPICKGKLLLSQSAYNGHVHGKCETHNCVSWME